MSTDDRILFLKKALDSLLRHDGPMAYLGRLPEDVDEDLWRDANALADRLRDRINELEGLRWLCFER